MAKEVRVLVAERDEAARFDGRWATFEGEEVASYKDEREGKNVVYTLYKCTAYKNDAYRVHVADETDPQKPAYKLLPPPTDPDGNRYPVPYDTYRLAVDFPLFLKHVDHFRSLPVDPQA